MAIRIDDVNSRLDEKDQDWIDWLMAEIEKAMDAESSRSERVGYWRAVADMQEGLPLRP